MINFSFVACKKDQEMCFHLIVKTVLGKFHPILVRHLQRKSSMKSGPPSCWMESFHTKVIVCGSFTHVKIL